MSRRTTKAYFRMVRKSNDDIQHLCSSSLSTNILGISIIIYKGGRLSLLFLFRENLYIMKIIELILLLVFYNIIPIWTEITFPTAAKVIGTVIMSIIFLAILIRSEKTEVKSFRLG